jgi:2-deoxy-D-gluconate 3-dehydrogenase
MADDVFKMFSLAGKKAMVTGASRGLGREFAITLAKAGADVALAARTVKGLEETAASVQEAGSGALVCEMDITDPAAIERAVDHAAAEFGRLDVLVNNAGIEGNVPVIDMTAEAWDKVMEVNLRGHVIATRAAGKHMVERKYGKVINVASILGLVGSAYNSPYGASKAGLIMFTKTAALEWARHNIQVNALCPGYFMTELNTEFFEGPDARKVVNQIPMRRVADPKELHGVLLLLASDASSFITGSIFTVDGGQTIK